MDDYDKSMDKRWKDVKDFLKEDFDIKNVGVEYIKNMWDWELIYFQYYCGMGMDDIYNDIWFLEDWKINYYRKYIYVIKTDKSMGPWFFALKSFRWLEDFDTRKNFEYRYNKHKESENWFKNYEYIDLKYWNCLLVNRKYFEDYRKFIKELTKKYNLWEFFFWVKITYVSKIFHSGNKEKFLSM